MSDDGSGSSRVVQAVLGEVTEIDGEGRTAIVTDNAAGTKESIGYDFRPPAIVADSSLAGPGGWPAVRFPTFGVDGAGGVSVIGDLASTSLTVCMAGTLAVHQAAFVADRIAAAAGGPPALEHPAMSAICFLDTGGTASFLHSDFTGPASGTGPAACTLMPWLPYFRSAKRLFAEEWFTSTIRGGVD